MGLSFLGRNKYLLPLLRGQEKKAAIEAQKKTRQAGHGRVSPANVARRRSLENGSRCRDTLGTLKGKQKHPIPVQDTPIWINR